jgi:hypothetical protein
MIRKDLIAVTRVLNFILDSKYSSPMGGSATDKEKKIIRNALENLSENEKNGIKKILKAGVLLTSGNVKTVRDPNNFKPYNNSTWAGVMGDSLQYILTNYKIMTNEELSQKITKNDYINSKIMLPILGSTAFKEFENKIISKSTGLNSDIVDRMTKNTDDNTILKKMNVEGFTPAKLYRGFHAMPESAILSLAKIGSSWDISRGVSTSMSSDIAVEFAGKDNPNRILFEIYNQEKKGFFFNNLSKYHKEDEVILSGVLEAIDYKIVPVNQFHNVFGEDRMRLKTKEGDQLLVDYMEIKPRSTLLEGTIEVGSGSEKRKLKFKERYNVDGYKFLEDFLNGRFSMNLRNVDFNFTKLVYGDWFMIVKMKLK